MGEGKVLAVASQKGGVGKTTLALNVAFAFAQRGWKVLLMDVDPQGSIGYSLQGNLQGHPGLAEVLSGDARLSAALVATRLPEMKILGVGEVAPEKTPKWSADLADGSRLSRVFAATRADYDLIVVDTPPAISGCTYGVLRSADSVIIPLQAEPLAARSVGRLLELLRALKDEGQAAELVALVVSMVQNQSESSLAIAQETWKIFPDNLVLEASIPRDDLFLLASTHGVPIGLLSRRPPAVATVFDRIAVELEPRIGLATDLGDEDPISLLE